MGRVKVGGGASAGGEGDAKKPKKEKTVWSETQEALLVTAVGRFGAGKWKEMVNEFDFEGKASKVLKDKWRHLSKRVAAVQKA